MNIFKILRYYILALNKSEIIYKKKEIFVVRDCAQKCLNMAMYDVYSHPEFRRYRASVCSKATLFMFIIYIFTFIIPILIVYRTNGECTDSQVIKPF